MKNKVAKMLIASALSVSLFVAGLVIFNGMSIQNSLRFVDNNSSGDTTVGYDLPEWDG